MASRLDTSPVAMGRSRVRLTCPSTLRSAKSLITQPAERITNTPSTKITNRCQLGKPSAASHNAHSVGQSNKKVPMGRFKRVRRKYTPRRSRLRVQDRKSTRLNSSHVAISYAVFCLTKKTKHRRPQHGDHRVSKHVSRLQCA